MKTNVKFIVCFIGEDGRHFHWRDYATYGGARRYIDERWGTAFGTGHKLVNWYILRQTLDYTEPIGRSVCGVVIAQQKNAAAQNPYRRKG